jgi:hypothetical protein
LDAGKPLHRFQTKFALSNAGAMPTAHASESPWRIFVLEGLTPTHAAAEETVQLFHRRLREHAPHSIEFFSDVLTSTAFRTKKPISHWSNSGGPPYGNSIE